MIPLHLTLSGFLSYRDPVELDFNRFDLACISGPNGAGKSSLLDAITWALFGQARKRDDSLINSQSELAEVRLVFAYEDNIYRIQRVKPRDKPMLLEFQILSGESEGEYASTKARWKPLTEHARMETEKRIQQTLRLDYDTFVNASFFLQGKADQFTQQRPGDRKRILGNILGLEIWETYRLESAERRRQVEDETAVIDGQLREINSELAEEPARREQLVRLEGELDRLKGARLSQGTLVENMRGLVASLAEQGRWVDSLRRRLEADDHNLQELETRLTARLQEQGDYIDLTDRAEQIAAAYQAWQASRQELERLEQIAGQFRQFESRRQAPLAEVQAARARLEQELSGLQVQQVGNEQSRLEIDRLSAEFETAEGKRLQLEAQVAQRLSLEAQGQALKLELAAAKTENQRLKLDMLELKGRIEQLEQAEGALCPLCGQPLAPQERLNLIASLTEQGNQMGDLYRSNQSKFSQGESQLGEIERELGNLSTVEAKLRAQSQAIGQITSRLQLLQDQVMEWQSNSAPRLGEVQQALRQEQFALEARQQLGQIDAELRQLGYDPEAHDLARQAELTGRSAEIEWQTLEKARAALAPLEREISELAGQAEQLRRQVTSQQEEFTQAAANLVAAQAQAPDLRQAERQLMEIEEQENILRRQVGGAQQRVTVLESLKTRRQGLEQGREELARRVVQYKQLERAFGKDGVPALLIEQALPQIETKANEILDRLSGGNMYVRFVTQAAYKDKARDDLKETLDIQISDSAGMRDYEMYSGGEAFRVNFAIRLALSEVLAQRAGARLQTLVIDEGFGSQDAQGRQRLIEAINLVRDDFEKILVITHIDELKDAFPGRIEVEKTGRGSTLRVI